MLNALTIDVEDYYQVSAFESVIKFEEWNQYESRVEQNTYRILDILDANQTKATFFVLGWIAEQHPKLVQEIQKRGHEVASHGYSHRRVYTQTPEQFRTETRRARYILEDIIGQPIRGYRAASYSITKNSLWALDILQEEGFVYDSSIFPIRHDLYGIPGYPRFCHRLNGYTKQRLVEFPISTLQLMGITIPVAGGGYLRLFPYPFIRWAIRHINSREHQPVIIYLHPWEIDPAQPRIHASLLSRFRHYLNLAKMEDRLRRLLQDFQFGTVSEVLKRTGFLLA